MDALRRFLTLSLRENTVELPCTEMLRDQVHVIADTIHLAGRDYAEAKM
jgi:hypothetical protein